jgi:hypothetical protein
MQGINVFASTAARNAAITSPHEGQFAFTKDTNGLWYYDGAAWVASGATGDIEGVTAGIGISGGGTSGTVTVTNSMATAIDAKGDLIGGTGADTFSRLAVGANDTVLTADSAQATGLKWATPAASTITYTTWTPTYTNFTLGNGTLVARYGTSGKFVQFTFAVQLGSTSSVSGQIRFTLPKTPKNTKEDLVQPLKELKKKIEEAEYQGRKVNLGKPFYTPGGPRKRAVYVKNEKGNVVKVGFGEPGMKIKKNNPARRKSFRARHNCENPGPRWKARYWSCRAW